ncbi:hypothetical protein D0869_08471 [Hortaea werneckii]|uniref:Uncharacterized protein n=1 Tax=Hortaea werneckii TaxID=91943 RepID=A0A3M6XBY9_HORWE|nr:hypothetical protein D0869_08471 [Hortaea werneckii]RMX88344.1 hypothetical protein D0867_15557 [Hortaea werneckii]RMY01929.1 hypothetical protein D0868_08236 [Hortaea werneckii]RMY38950.1 hypothetical protein D0866_02250 [Hortaea werneckii]RMY45014.1 hypothetical protein D0865_10181 [Hortaea werneckii]
MATRRGAEQEKTHLDQDEIKEGKPSNISPAVPGSVIAKLLGFTFAMVTLPLGSYFASVNTIFGGNGVQPPPSISNSTYAGALAALMANVVLIGYVIVAFQDDQSEREADEAEKKKSK